MSNIPRPSTLIQGRTIAGENLPVKVESDGSLGISATVTGADGAIEDGVTASIRATVKNYTDSNPLAVILVDTNGDPIGGSAVSISDGSDVAEGATTDVAVTGDNAGTVSAKLRGLNKILADVWDSVGHLVKVSIQNTTLAVTQSGSWVLSAGSALIGKVGIDQTTPGTTNGVVVNSSALPTGAATETTLAAAKTDLDALAGIVSASKAAVTAADGDLATIGAKADAKATDSTSSWSAIALLKGLYALLAGTLTVSASSLPLPTGAATATNQTGGSQKTQVVDGSGNVIGSTGNALDVNIKTPNPVPVSGSFAFGPQTSGGTSDYHKISAASNNADTIKASAGQVYGVSVFNNAQYPVYVKLYNKASAPAPASDTPIRTIGVQAGVCRDVPIFYGLACATGIAIAIVKGIADNDNTSVAASDCAVDVDYA